MKNSFVLFLLTTYIISTTSLSIGIHECAGEESYSIFGISLNFKCECNHLDEDHNKCCKDHTILIKDKILKKETAFKKFVIENISSHLSLIVKPIAIFHYIGLENYQLPTGHPPPLFILFRVFRI